MLLAGGCMYGAVRYEAEGPPDTVVVCHCPDCRHASGAQSLAWFFVSRERFRYTRGLPAMYPSPEGVERRFCGTCGTTLS